MRRGALLFLLATAVASQQARGKEATTQHNQKKTISAPVKPPRNPPQSQSNTRGCPGSYHPELDCSAISANAEVDQANSAKNQSWLFTLEIGLTFITLLIAFGAMLYARSASKSAADNLVHEKGRARTDFRPWLMVSAANVNPFLDTLVEGVRVAHGLSANLEFRNFGRHPALDSVIKIVHAVAPYDSNDPPEFPVLVGPGYPAAIGPNRPTTTNTLPVGPTDHDAIMARSKCLWLYAVATYKSPEHEGEDYRTQFCAKVTYAGDVLEPNGTLRPTFSVMIAGPLNTMT